MQILDHHLSIFDNQLGCVGIIGENFQGILIKSPIQLVSDHILQPFLVLVLIIGEELEEEGRGTGQYRSMGMNLHASHLSEHNEPV